MIKVFYWDYFGPNAQGTASHFKRHLDEFLELHNLGGCVTGETTHAEGHWCAFCAAPEPAHDTLTQVLRPRREASLEEHEKVLM